MLLQGNTDGAAWKRVSLTHFKEKRRTRPAKKDISILSDWGNMPQLARSMTYGSLHSENHCCVLEKQILDLPFSNLKNINEKKKKRGEEKRREKEKKRSKAKQSKAKKRKEKERSYV